MADEEVTWESIWGDESKEDNGEGEDESEGIEEMPRDPSAPMFDDTDKGLLDPEKGRLLFDSGTPIDEMTPEEARREWREIVNDKHPERYEGWPRQVILDRMNRLYAHGMLTQEQQREAQAEEKKARELEKTMQRFEDRDSEAAIRRTKEQLIIHFGGEKKYERAVKTVQTLLGQFARSPEDLRFIEDAEVNGVALGNDPEVIKLLSALAGKLRVYRAAYAKSKNEAE